MNPKFVIGLFFHFLAHQVIVLFFSFMFSTIKVAWVNPNQHPYWLALLIKFWLNHHQIKGCLYDLVTCLFIALAYTAIYVLTDFAFNFKLKFTAKLSCSSDYEFLIIGWS